VSYAVTPSNAQIAAYELQLSNSGATWAPWRAKDQATGAGTTRALTKAPISNEIRFRVRANSPDGQTSRWVASAAFNLCLYEEPDANVRWAGLLRSEALPGSSSGTVKWAASRANAKFTFTGNSVGFVSTYGPDRGIATFKIDGVKRGRINLYGPRVRAGR